jgi:hypothetical protein
MNRLLEQLITLRMLGGEAVSDTALLNDPALGALFDWDEIAHPSTFGRRLGQMRWLHNLGLERIVTGLSDRVVNKGQRLVAIDSTVSTVPVIRFWRWMSVPDPLWTATYGPDRVLPVMAWTASSAS